jgi:hypothetical protein
MAIIRAAATAKWPRLKRVTVTVVNVKANKASRTKK